MLGVSGIWENPLTLILAGFVNFVFYDRKFN